MTEFTVARLIAVMAGSAVGGALRWLLVMRVDGEAARFPAGTMLVNIVGSFLIGLAAAWFAGRSGHVEWRLLAITGVLGGFTTFSAFSLQTLELLGAGRWQAAIGYVTGSVVLCLAAAAVGFRLVPA